MTKHIYQGHFQDGTGRAIASGSVTVYLADTTTLATIYPARSGGDASATSDSDSVVSSDTSGKFVLYVDDTDYTPSQNFDLKLSKTGYTTQYYYNTRILPSAVFATSDEAAGAGADGTISSRSANALGECDGFLKLTKEDGTTAYVPYWDDITP